MSNVGQNQEQSKERNPELGEVDNMSDLDEGQDHEQEPSQMPFVGQDRAPSPRTKLAHKRRKLDLVKCDRCRVDKQKAS